MRLTAKKVADVTNAEPICERCNGELWVCEDHPDRACGQGDGCCGAPAMPCVCNPIAQLPPGSTIIVSHEGVN